MKDFFKEMAPYLVSLVIILYLYFEGKFVVKTFGNKYSSIEHLLYYYSLCTLFLVMVALYKSKLKHEKFSSFGYCLLNMYKQTADINSIKSRWFFLCSFITKQKYSLSWERKYRINSCFI